MITNNEDIKGIIECQILSRILLDKTNYLIDKYELKSDDFDTPLYNDRKEKTCNTKDIFNFIRDHYSQYSEIPDITTVMSRFQGFDLIEGEDNENYLITTLRDKTNDKNFANLLMTLKRLHLDKGYKSAANYMKNNLNSFLDIPIADVGVDIIHEGADARLKTYEEVQSHPELATVDTGLKELDELIGGLSRKEELFFIQARTGNAKTFLLIKILFEAWAHGETVGIYEPEMSPELLGYRFDSYKAQLSNFNLHKGRALSKNYRDYISDLKKAENKFYVFTQKDFQGCPTVSKFRALCKKKNITVFAIDGFQIDFVFDDRMSKDLREDQILSHIAYDLVDMSRDMNIPVICAIQSGRIDKNTELDVNTVKGGYAVSQACTGQVTIKTENKQSVIKIVKARYNGAVGKKLLYQVDLDKGCWSFEGDESSTISKSNSQISTNPGDKRVKSNENISAEDIFDNNSEVIS